ncbi:MAG TPA: hypothetical protein V6D07_09800 [Trichocoleus sp.]
MVDFVGSLVRTQRSTFLKIKINLPENPDRHHGVQKNIDELVRLAL